MRQPLGPRPRLGPTPAPPQGWDWPRWERPHLEWLATRPHGCCESQTHAAPPAPPRRLCRAIPCRRRASPIRWPQGAETSGTSPAWPGTGRPMCCPTFGCFSCRVALRRPMPTPGLPPPVGRPPGRPLGLHRRRTPCSRCKCWGCGWPSRPRRPLRRVPELSKTAEGWDGAQGKSTLQIRWPKGPPR